MAMSHVCACCGRSHENLPLDLGFVKPGAFLELKSSRERARCQLTADTCVMPGPRYFLRGRLPVPLHDSERVFLWSVWAEVGPHVYERHLLLRETQGTYGMPVPGALSVEREPSFRGMDRLPVLLRFTEGHSPLITLEPSNHWLCRDQQNGLTLHHLHERLHALFPGRF
jgi:hypothetical protein